MWDAIKGDVKSFGLHQEMLGSEQRGKENRGGTNKPKNTNNNKWSNLWPGNKMGLFVRKRQKVKVGFFYSATYSNDAVQNYALPVDKIQ